ncbi:MAG: DNA repair protein RecO, partial [Gammaproteobacteria bacterium]
MSDYAVYLQPAFILHSRQYRETSLILEVLTEEYGRFSLVAKGVRRKKPGVSPGVLRSFTTLKISYSGRAELRTLIHAEPEPPVMELSPLGLFCGFYINELINLFLHKHDPHPEVYAGYKRCLEKLASGDPPEAALRLFELDLLDSVGYGLELEFDALSGKPLKSDKRYRYLQDEGPVESESGMFRGSTLLALNKRELSDR